MRLPVSPAAIPGRATTGAYVLHSGLQKLSESPEEAKGVHDMAVKAFPFLAAIPPARFLRLLGTAETAVGVALLLPLVPDAVAGAGLTAFAGALVTMYARTPSLHEPHSVWPRPAGIAVSKDVWMIGVGLGLIIGSGRRQRSAR